MTDAAIRSFVYLLDPLCGWCYGAAPAIRWLREQPGVTLQARPVGLFAWDQARALDGMRDHIHAADARIAALTGQVFSAAYADRVIGDAAARLDSGPATSALFAAERQRAGGALDLLAAIQAARWVEGRDIADRAVLGALAAGLGLVLPDDDVADDAALRQWVDEAAMLLTRSGTGGVPTLLRQQDGRLQLVPSAYLYQSRARLADLLAA
jgi:putative protein-disulfide isomerase